MKRSIIIIVLAVAGTAAAAAPAARGAEAFPSGAELLDAARAGSIVAADLGHLGRQRLRLREHGLLAADALFTVRDARGVREVAPPSVVTLAGEVVGEPGSVVRLTVMSDGARRGFVATRAGIASIDAGSGTVIDPAGLPQGALIDDPPPAPKDHGSVPVSLLGAGNCSVLPCGTLTAHVVLDGDDTHRSVAPATCMERQVAVLNDVDGIYALAETDIRLDVTQVNCWTTNVSLGGPATSPEDYLRNLRLAWSNVGADRSTVLHAAGFDFTSSAIGIAYVGGVCARLEPAALLVPGRCPFGYGVYQTAATGGYGATAFLQAKVAAHELGHNFNAMHDTAEGCSGSGTIMCASLQPSGPNTFSSASAAVIREHAEGTIGFLACPVGRDGSLASDDC